MISIPPETSIAKTKFFATLTAAAITLLFAVATDPASASRTIKRFSGPAIDSDVASIGGRFYTTLSTGKKTHAIDVISSTGKRRRVYEFKYPYPGGREVVFRGSDQVAAAHFSFFEGYNDGSTSLDPSKFVAGPVGGRMRSISRCSPVSFSVSERKLVSAADCEDDSLFRIQVFELRGKRVRLAADIPLPKSIKRRGRYTEFRSMPVSVAGSYVAVAGTKDVVVINWRSGMIVRRIAQGLHVSKLIVDRSGTVHLTKETYTSCGSMACSPEFKSVLEFPADSDTPVEFTPDAPLLNVDTRENAFLFRLTNRGQPQAGEVDRNKLIGFNVVRRSYEPLGTAKLVSAVPFGANSPEFPFVHRYCWDRELRVKAPNDPEDSPATDCPVAVVKGTVVLDRDRFSYKISCPEGCVPGVVNTEGVDYRVEAVVEPGRTVRISFKLDRKLAGKIRSSRSVTFYYGDPFRNKETLAVRVK